MSKWNEIAEILYDNFKINDILTREEITSLAIKDGIIEKFIRTNTWNALFTHNILSNNTIEETYCLLPRIKKEKNLINKGERQIHGFQFENYIKKYLNISDCPNGHYTYKWDGILNNYPVSIKTAKYGTDIEMASFLRNAQNTEDFYLIVGFWEGEKNNIVETYILFIPGEEWHKLFNEQIVQECIDFLGSVTNDVSDDKKWEIGRNILKEKWINETCNLIRPRFKRDHKTQKRMQCAINNNDFYNYFIPKYKKEELLYALANKK